jgi:hypothetical protein
MISCTCAKTQISGRQAPSRSGRESASLYSHQVRRQHWRWWQTQRSRSVIVVLRVQEHH